MRLFSLFLTWLMVAELTPAGAATVVINSYRFAASGPTYLVNENFEGAGTPASWFRGGSADFDYTSTALAGSESLSVVQGTSDAAIYNVDLNVTEITVHFRMRRPSALPASFSKFFVILQSDLSTTGLALYFMTDGTITVESGSIFTATVDAMSVDTTYDVKVHFKKGSGANGQASVEFVASGGSFTGSGNKFAGATNGNMTVNGSYLEWLAISATGSFIFDTCQAAAADF